ncbi:MAG: ribonuclease Y [Chitinophagales bacterium]|tara:strand:+ start:52402 stop:54000 length:1599 start_codon:yes stop_codon:yes gene_type:complete
MNPMIVPIIASVVCLAVGLVIGKMLTNSKAKEIDEAAKKEAELIISNAKAKSDTFFEKAKAKSESIKQSKILETKENFIQKKANFEEETSERKERLRQKEQQFKENQQNISKKIEENSRKEKELDTLKSNLSEQVELMSIKKEKVDKQHEEFVNKLEKISNLSASDAKEELIETLKKEAKTDAMSHIKQIMDDAKAQANKEAKKIVIQTIQRTAAEHAIENTVSVFNLESDDQKGQIIGREGRNIRAIEAATGCEIVVDDTPEAIVISGYDPIRREIARLSLQKLTADGRIHPARIEEVVKKTTKQLNEHLMEIGERTVIDMGISGLHPELVRYVGRMRFRSSYGQNLLQHSRETANLCATMAAELGLNVKLAKRAGLLHDIGKVPDEESELSHALLGMKLCEKYGEHPAVCNAVGAHHDEMEMRYAISPIIQACDAISGARPGARREVMESYLERIKELETLALEYEGVDKAYAIQAGRELRVIVESGKVDDKRSEELSFEISKKIEEEMTYPGQVKVTVIREMRAVTVAR